MRNLACKIDVHADCVPLAVLFPWRCFASRIFHGAQAAASTFHDPLVEAEYAEIHPAIVTA